MNKNIGECNIIYKEFLGHYLTVYNRYTGNEIGCIGNLSVNSLMLMTPWMMEIGSVFYFRILLPTPIDGKMEVDFDVKCQWCHPDSDPRGYDSGYTIIDKSENYTNLISALSQYFTFNHDGT